MSLKNTLGALGIHEHWNPTLAEVNIVYTEPGQPAPSPDTEITLRDHIFVPGRILEDRVILTETTRDGLEEYTFRPEDDPSILHFAARLADNITMMQ